MRLWLGDVLVGDVTEGPPRCDSTQRIRQSHRSRKWGSRFLGPRGPQSGAQFGRNADENETHSVAENTLQNHLLAGFGKIRAAAFVQILYC